MKYLSILTLLLAFSSCNQKRGDRLLDQVKKAEAIMIDVELLDKSSLFILLVKDGTINRKGNLKTADNNFFMGITKENLFDDLLQTVTNDLAAYCGKVYGAADSTKNVNKVKIVFSGPEGETGVDYYSLDPIDKLPKPITEFIYKSIQITDPWFESQQKLLPAK